MFIECKAVSARLCPILFKLCWSASNRKKRKSDNTDGCVYLSRLSFSRYIALYVFYSFRHEFLLVDYGSALSFVVLGLKKVLHCCCLLAL